MRALLLLITCLACALLTASPAMALEARGDFNNDGRQDLAIGVPDETLGGKTDAGTVTVIYGAGGGMAPSVGPRAQLFDQDSPGIPGAAERGDRFGAALAGGDFNNDDFDDLVVGVPGEDLGSQGDAGSVNVIYGSAAGLAAAGGPGAQLRSQSGVFGSGETGDRFGAALASGDFDSSSRDDLAVGAPGEDSGAGAVDVIYASGSGGLDSSVGADEAVSQSTTGVPGSAERGDGFGGALVGGDLNGDGDDDLAVGIPGEDLGQKADAGALAVVYSSGLPDQGLEPVAGGAGRQPGAQLFDQDSPGIPGAAESGDHFGRALESANFNYVDPGDSPTSPDPSGGADFDDLAAGVPEENLGSQVDAGSVNVIYGSAAGLAAAGGPGAQLRSQSGVFGSGETGDRFGAALANGDFDSSTLDDLAVGAPGEDSGAGAVDLIYAGGAGGLEGIGLDEVFSQNTAGVPGESERGDGFGGALAGGDFNGDGNSDLAIGIPDENLGAKTDAGALGVIYNSGISDFGLEPVPSGAGRQPKAQLFDQDSPGVPGAAEGADRFGSTL